MNDFTKDNLKLIREALNQALISVSTKFDIDLKVGAITFTQDSFTAKLIANIKKSSEEKESECLEEWNQYAELIGLKKEHYGKSFTAQGKTFTITGLKLQNRKMPVLASDTNGKKYKLSVETIQNYLK
jgi:hypothetical protein